MIQQMIDFHEKAGYLSEEMYQARNALGRELFKRIEKIYGQEVARLLPW